MSVERLQTVLQLSAEGADAVIAEINRVARAMQGTTGATAFTGLPTNIGSAMREQRPQTFDRIARYQADAEIADRNLAEAKGRRAAAAKVLERLERDNLTESDAYFKAQRAAYKAETGELRATKAVDAARERLAQEIYKELPAVQERVRQERLAGGMARDYVAQKNQQAAEERRNARERTRAEQAEIRERQRSADSLGRQRNREQAKAAELEFTRGQNAISREELSRMLATPDRQLGDSDRVYSARKMLADAQINRAVMEERLAATVERAAIGDLGERNKALQAVNSATQAQSAAARRVVAAEERLERAIQVQATAMAIGQRESFRESFVAGFRGRGDNAPNYGEQLGQAFKFSVFYGTAYKLLFGITQTLQATWTEAVQWQDAMTNLKLATGESEESLDDISRQLATQATRAGFAPSQGLEIGARSLGLYGVVDENRATQDRVMMQSARIVNQLAVGSGQQPVDLQGNIAAIAQALGMGATGQFRIADLDAYMTKKFGVAQGSTLEVVAQSASVGKAAGFTDEQLFGIAAQLLSRTGQSGSAVSGYMAQIFSRGGEGSLVDVARRRGIDPQQDLAGILAQLAQQYQTASGPEQAEISAAFGRGKVQNAAVALLQDYDEVLSRSGQAMTDATGQADAQFKLRMDNIGGQVDRLMGVMREFASLLGESGLLDVVGLGIVTFRELLEVVNSLLTMWNTLPDVVQDMILAFGLATIAFRTQAAQGAIGMIGQARPGVQRGLAMAGLGTGIVEGANPALRSTTGLRGLAGAGAAAIGLANPITYAIGGLLALGAIKGAADRMNDALNQSRAALADTLGPDASPSEYRASASELRGMARQNREATPGWLNALTFGQANDDNEAMRERLRREARRLEDLAARVEARDSRLPTPETGAIASSAAEDVSRGLQALEAGGFTAQERLRSLTDVLFGTADAAEAAAAAFDPRIFSSQNAGGVLDAVGGAFKGAIFGQQVVTGGQAGIPVTGTRFVGANAIRARMRNMIETGDVDKRLRQALKAEGVQSEADITPQNVDEISARIASGWGEMLLEPYTDNPEAIKEWQKKINDAISRYLLGQTTAIRDLVSGNNLSREDALAGAQSITDLTGMQLGTLGETDTEARGKVLRRQIRQLTRIQRNAIEPVGEIGLMIDAARRELANNQFEELERLRRIAQRNARSKAEIARVGQRFMRREIRSAIRGGDSDLLVGILEQAGKGAANFARQTIQDALNVIAQSIETALLLNSVGHEIDGVVQGAAAGWREGLSESEADSVNGPLRKRRRELNRMLKAIEKSLSARGDDNVYFSGSDSGNPLLDPEKDSTKEDKDSPAEIAAARAAAFATRSQSQIQSARAAILSARASLADAKKNTVEYWNAMGELFAAQQALTEAVRAYRINQMRLRGDITNPLFNARVQTREAAMRLRQDRASGAGADVLAQDRIDLREARANEESTRFSQRLQAVQTAEELGRISHSKYMNYLENEKRRLEGIKNRTFQQQEQLDQIDRLMKDAATQMQGQFNLGDIKLPTPYQVRRYIEQTSPARTERMAATYASTTNITNYINGADTAAVKRAIREQVGKGGRVRTAAPRKR